MNRRRWWAVAAAVVVVALAAWWFLSRQASRPQPRAQLVERGPLVATVSATGTIRPVVQVEVGSQVSGTIARLFADYNDRVRSGQVLVQLEPSLFRAAVVQAEANVSKAEAALAEADRAYKRARDLRARSVISEADLETAQSSYEQRRAELKQAQAALSTARVNLGHTTIRSPISGVVVSRQVDVGQTVAASLQAPTLFTLAQDLTRMRVETKIDEADVGRIRPGLQATFTVDAFPDDVFEGAVSQVRLEPVVEENVVTYTTVIDVPNETLKLRPGMTANVTLVVDRRRNALKVPNAALRFRPPESARSGVRAETREAAGESRGAAGSATGGRGPGGGGGAPGGGWRGARSGDGLGAGGGRGAWSQKGPRDSSARAGMAGPGGRPQRVFVLDAGGKMHPVRVGAGISDGAFTEVVWGDLKEGDRVVVGMEGKSVRSDLPAPPGFGPGRGPR